MYSYPTRKRKFLKNSKIIQKIRKHHHNFFSSQNRMGNAEKERSSDVFLPDSEKKIPKK